MKCIYKKKLTDTNNTKRKGGDTGHTERPGRRRADTKTADSGLYERIPMGCSPTPKAIRLRTNETKVQILKRPEWHFSSPPNTWNNRSH